MKSAGKEKRIDQKKPEDAENNKGFFHVGSENIAPVFFAL
jgi:hypothetical protein